MFLSPWAEYAILHLDVLYGGDRLVNLVEFASMGGTLIGVSLIAERLGASKRGQLLAVLACATLPEGVLEASGAMNTYVGAFWIVVTVYYLLRWNDRQNWNVGPCDRRRHGPCDHDERHRLFVSALRYPRMLVDGHVCVPQKVIGVCSRHPIGGPGFERAAIRA